MTGLVNRHTNSSLQLKASSIFAEVNGFAARVLATLTYCNDCEYDVEGLFIFPQDERATVVEFEATIEERHVSTQVSEIITRNSEKHAFALEERDDDLFSLSLGRIPPLTSVFVQVTLITELGTDETTGGSLFVLPSVFTPRLSSDEKEETDLYGSQMLITNIPRKTQEPYSFELQLEVAAPCLLAGCSSRTHAIQVDADCRATNASRIHITIAEAHTYDRELEVVLHLSHPYDPYVLIEEGKKGFNSLRGEDKMESSNNSDTLEDFHKKAAIMINYTPRLPTPSAVGEFIFLVDRSGSMSGDHIFHVKETLILFLKSLPANCCFNVIGFGSYHRSLFQESQPYNETTLGKACTYVHKMRADLGGSNLLLPLEFIFEKPTKLGVGRTVFMLTDGGISNTLEVVDFVRRNSYTTRFYTFGIGPEACPNLVQGVAGAGRGQAYFIADDERMPVKVMEALADALQPAITDLEVSWHLPDGYDVIQTPQLLPFVQNNKRLVIYAILYRPPGEEKDSPRTPIKRKMDWSMRSFSNSSVKVFWFEDECDLLAEDQLLLEVEESLPLSDDDFEKDQTFNDEARVPEQDSFDVEMESVPEKNTIEAIADGLLKRLCRDFSQEKASSGDDHEITPSLAVLENSEPCESRNEDSSDDWSREKKKNGRPDITSVYPDVSEQNNNGLYSTKNKSPNIPKQDVFSDIKDSNLCNDDSKKADESHEHQRSPKLVRAYERDSGVGFSMEESDKSPDERRKAVADVDCDLNEEEEEPNDWSRNSDSPIFEEFNNTRKTAVHIYKNSEFLSQLGVPADFGAVNIRGFVGDEEMEQVIPFPVNRCGGSSKRPTIHQLLARSLIRELQSSVDSAGTETIEIIKRMSELSSVHSRHTALVARDQYCYDDQVLSALQFPQTENLTGFGNRKVKVLKRNSDFTEGLGRRLPSPDGSDQDISPYFAEGGNNPILETGEEPVDFYRLERTGTPESQHEESASRKDAQCSQTSPSKSPHKHVPPLSTRCVLGERQQSSSKVKPKLLSSSSFDTYWSPMTKQHLSFVRMISLQSAQGSWNIEHAFAEVLGLSLNGIQEASPLADNSVYIADDLQELMDSDTCDNSSQLWATALALSWLYRKRRQFEAEWSLAAKKAEDWMNGIPCPRGFSPDDLKALAYQALLLLETETRKSSTASTVPQGKIGLSMVSV